MLLNYPLEFQKANNETKPTALLVVKGALAKRKLELDVSEQQYSLSKGGNKDNSRSSIKRKYLCSLNWQDHANFMLLETRCTRTQL